MQFTEDKWMKDHSFQYVKQYVITVPKYVITDAMHSKIGCLS